MKRPTKDNRGVTSAVTVSRAQAALTPFTDAPKLPALSPEAEARQKAQRASIAGGGPPTIRVSGGGFLFPGAQQGVESFDGAVLVGLRHNAYWMGKYNPNDPTPPDCSAIARLGQHENEMVPDPASPAVQAESCRVCPHNVGPNKACRNGVWEAVLHGDGLLDPESARKSTIALLRVSSTGIAPFGNAIRYLDEKGVRLNAAMMRFATSFTPTAAGGYHTVLSEPLGVLPAAVVEVLDERVPDAEQRLLEWAKPVPQVAEQPTSAPAPRKRGTLPVARPRSRR